MVPHVDHLFSRASWPWTVSRESLLLLGNRGKHTKTEVARLYRSPDFGPVGCLAVAYAYSHLDPQTARIFAKRGLERLTAEYFARDCQALFQPDAPQASLPSRALRTLGRLEPADVDAISALLPPDLAAPFKLLARHYRTSPDNPLPADLQAQLWDAGIKGSVESALKTLSTLP